MNTALIIGHPGHELRIYKFLQVYKPRVYILTDGSGSKNRSRVDSSLKIISATGANPSKVMGRFTDRQLYQIILERKFGVIASLIEEICLDLIEHQINMVVGDALEGFNPTHDLCRYMINCLVKRLQKQTEKEILNYDFLLEGSPLEHESSGGMRPLILHLSEEELERKIGAAENYNEIKVDFENALVKYGRSTFKVETLRPVQTPYLVKSWTTEDPYYEEYGRRKVELGQYENAISFKSHLLPFVEALSRIELSNQ